MKYLMRKYYVGFAHTNNKANSVLYQNLLFSSKRIRLQMFCLISKFNRIILYFSQLVMTFTGFLANLATLIVLKKNKSIFSRVIRLLLINQSFIDSLACLFAAILILQVGCLLSEDF